MGTGTRLAATSNTPPNALGEGRFAAQDFLREIHAMAESFQTIRIDGNDYRHRTVDGHAEVLDPPEYEAAIADAATQGLASDDSFGDLVAHLARVHPSRYIRIIDGLVARRPPGRRTAHRSIGGAAVRRVHRPRLRRGDCRSARPGVSLDLVFPDEMLAGGYRKKYLRAISRLVALHAQLTSRREPAAFRMRSVTRCLHSGLVRNRCETWKSASGNVLSANSHSGLTAPSGVGITRDTPERQPMQILAAAADYDAQTAVNSLWLIVAAALVLLMTPGVAFFYGGMVKAKSVIR